jgi:hypothetical protein
MGGRWRHLAEIVSLFNRLTQAKMVHLRPYAVHFHLLLLASFEGFRPEMVSTTMGGVRVADRK